MHFSGVKFSQEDLLCVKKLHSTTLELQAFKVCECRPFFNCHTCTFQLELKIWRKIYSDKEYSRWILLSMPKRKKLGTSWFFFHLVFVVYAWLLSPSVTDCCCLWPTNNMDFANLCYFCYLWSVVTFWEQKNKWYGSVNLANLCYFVTYDLKSHLRATNKLCGSVDLVRPLFFSPLRSICARPHFPNHFTHFNKQPQNWPRQENHFFKAMTYKNLRLSASFHSFDNRNNNKNFILA